jgi:dTDP-4-dehydrorhamnose reductase
VTILIVGGDSAIAAAAIAALHRRGTATVATSRRPGHAAFLDLAQPPASWRLPACESCLVAAAIGTLAGCEADPCSSRRINVESVAAIAARVPFTLILSTTQVFDGTTAFATPDTPTAPRTQYGTQKAEAERVVLAAGGAALRVSKVLVPDLPLLRGFAATLRAGGTVEAFADLMLSPVTGAQVAEAAAEILIHRRPGLHQLSGDRDVSYADLARRMAALLGRTPESVVETSWRGRLPEAFVQDHTTLAPTLGPAPSSLAVIDQVLTATLSLPER